MKRPNRRPRITAIPPWHPRRVWEADRRLLPPSPRERLALWAWLKPRGVG